jgi:hypothetical protein
MSNTIPTKPTASHTPGPWQYGYTPHACNGLPHKVFVDGDEVASCGKEAHARRIVAAVNACEGILTEALERGAIADLRCAVGVLLTAASDLEAVIDGATHQFDAECAWLNAALRTAQAALDGVLEIDVHELLAGRRQIAHIWGIDDVRDTRPDLDDDQAWQVLEKVERRLDSQYGISWDTIEIVAEDLFGPAPETDEAEED